MEPWGYQIPHLCADYRTGRGGQVKGIDCRSQVSAPPSSIVSRRIRCLMQVDDNRVIGNEVYLQGSQQLKSFRER